MITDTIPRGFDFARTCSTSNTPRRLNLNALNTLDPTGNLNETDVFKMMVRQLDKTTLAQITGLNNLSSDNR